MKSEIIQAIKEDRLYDFIAKRYWKIDQAILKDLLLELIYMIYYDYEYCIEENKETLNKYIIECLEENRGWEE